MPYFIFIKMRYGITIGRDCYRNSSNDNLCCKVPSVSQLTAVPKVFGYLPLDGDKGAFFILHQGFYNP